MGRGPAGPRSRRLLLGDRRLNADGAPEMPELSGTTGELKESTWGSLHFGSFFPMGSATGLSREDEDASEDEVADRRREEYFRFEGGYFARSWNLDSYVYVVGDGVWRGDCACGGVNGIAGVEGDVGEA